MYLTLLHSVAKTIDELQKTVLDAEEIYVSEEELLLTLVQSTEEQENADAKYNISHTPKQNCTTKQSKSSGISQ